VDLIIHVDGGARGNPGPAGAGVVIEDEQGRLIHEAGYFLGRHTNNAAEYHALLRALERAARVQSQALTICCDSELLVRQLTGEYQVRSDRLMALFNQAQLLLVRGPRWTIKHIPREQNQRADRLANLAMDQQRDIILFDVDQPQSVAAVRPPEPDSAQSAAGEIAADQPRPAATRRPAETVGEGSKRRAVCITLVRHPLPGCCPAGGVPEPVFTVENSLPAGLCIHAAYALLPTLLAIQNTDPGEFAAVPTLTVRCSHPGCGAEFTLCPVRSSNGVPRRPTE